MSTVQAGMIFSGAVGTGIFMKHNVLDGTWSNPVAVGLSGVGFGFVMGANLKDVLLFMPDDETVETFFSKGVEMSAQMNLTMAMGREFETMVGGSSTGTAAIESIAYSRGAFISANLQGAIVGPRPKANEAFYGPGNYDPARIVDGQIPFPIDKHTLIEDVKAKLVKCVNGETQMPGEDDKAKAEAALDHAHAAAGAVDDDIVHVNIEEEAAKEAA